MACRAASSLRAPSARVPVRFLLEEKLEFCDRIGRVALLLVGARCNLRRIGVRPLQVVRLAAGRDRLVDVMIHKLNVREQTRASLHPSGSTTKLWLTQLPRWENHSP